LELEIENPDHDPEKIFRKFFEMKFNCHHTLSKKKLRIYEIGVMDTLILIESKKFEVNNIANIILIFHSWKDFKWIEEKKNGNFMLTDQGIKVLKKC